MTVGPKNLWVQAPVVQPVALQDLLLTWPQSWNALLGSTSV